MCIFYTACNECSYCMPCPYGIDIPNIFRQYNKCLNEGNFPTDENAENYVEARRAFLSDTTERFQSCDKQITAQDAVNASRFVRKD